MFADRGKRMFGGDNDDDGDNEDDGQGTNTKTKKKKKVMSALALFLKDMDIVHSEAKRLECPTPMASAALQQFVAGASLGLSREDDSQVVKVYEALSGVSVTPTPTPPPSPPAATPLVPTTTTPNNEGNAIG